MKFVKYLLAIIFLTLAAVNGICWSQIIENIWLSVLVSAITGGGIGFVWGFIETLIENHALRKKYRKEEYGN